jgi:8-oxo-dGTP pyrophosphatase MutT (NUDIX family)
MSSQVVAPSHVPALPPAAIVIVRAGRTRVPLLLTVSRPEPPHEMAMPGGVIEPGETAEEAARRELEEETGVRAGRMRCVWIGTSPTDGRTVYVFAAETWTGMPRAAEPETSVAWMTPGQIVRQGTRFGSFSERLFEEYRP